MAGMSHTDSMDVSLGELRAHDPGAGWTAGPGRSQTICPQLWDPFLTGRRQQLLWSLEGASVPSGSLASSGLQDLLQSRYFS